MKFNGNISLINNHKVVRIPSAISETFPSRGMVMCHVKIKDHAWLVPVEPDGKGGHWMEFEDEMLSTTNINLLDSFTMDIILTEEWVSPQIPELFLQVLEYQGLVPTWHSLTIKAQWEWIRWIRSTKNEKTQQKRIDTACSMLSGGKRRPCCFNSSQCTVTDVSKTGVIIE